MFFRWDPGREPLDGCVFVVLWFVVFVVFSITITRALNVVVGKSPTARWPRAARPRHEAANAASPIEAGAATAHSSCRAGEARVGVLATAPLCLRFNTAPFLQSTSSIFLGSHNTRRRRLKLRSRSSSNKFGMIKVRVVMPCTLQSCQPRATPNTNSAMAFVEMEDLKDRTFGELDG